MAWVPAAKAVPGITKPGRRQASLWLEAVPCRHVCGTERGPAVGLCDPSRAFRRRGARHEVTLQKPWIPDWLYRSRAPTEMVRRGAPDRSLRNLNALGCWWCLRRRRSVYHLRISWYLRSGGTAQKGGEARILPFALSVEKGILSVQVQSPHQSGLMPGKGFSPLHPATHLTWGDVGTRPNAPPPENETARAGAALGGKQPYQQVRCC